MAPSNFFLTNIKNHTSKKICIKSVFYTPVFRVRISLKYRFSTDGKDKKKDPRYIKLKLSNYELNQEFNEITNNINHFIPMV